MDAPADPRRECAQESGRISVLLAGLLSVLLSLTLVIAGATSMHLERKRLMGLADGAATHAANALNRGEYFARAHPGDTIVLSDAGVQAAAAEYVASAPAARRLQGVRVVSPTGTPDGFSAEVTLVARVRPAILPADLAHYLPGVEVRFTSAARAWRG